ncbi:MAG TPA: hypothetical protein VN775_13940 [Opitutaceae bacterium]|nr:hypothetical protein [Opitutaceae bacterium]
MNSLKKMALVTTAVLSVGLARVSAQVSLRGIYTTAVNSTLTAVIAVHDNNNLDAFLFDTGQMEVGKGATTIDASGNFTLSGVIGYGMTGTLTATGSSASISGSVTNPSWAAPEAYTAPRTVFFGANNSGGVSIINGRFTGKVSNESTPGQTNITLIVDANNNIYLIHEYPGGTYGGGIGTVTPNSSETGGTFQLTGVKGEAVTGTFTTNAFTMAGSFTDTDGSYVFTAFRDAAANRLGNISTRGFVGTGQNVLIGGFVIAGGPKLVLIRVLGPGLANYGITSPLMDPTVTLYKGQNSLASDTGWQNQNSGTVAQIQATKLAPPDAGDDAILIQLEAGAYTTVVAGASGDTGTALVEVYEVLLD